MFSDQGWGTLSCRPPGASKAPTRAGSFMPVAAGFPTHLQLGIPQPWLPPPCPVLIGRFELQGSLRRKYTEVGLKPQLSPRGVATREEELKSFLAIADQIPMIIYEKSEQTVSVLATETCVAVAAVDSGGKYMWDLAQVRV